jgi:hypothetical protein
MKISKERLKQLIQEELSIGIGMMPEDEMTDGETPKDPHGYEGRMVKQNLWKMAEYAKEMYDLIEDDDDLEPWVEEKIAVASFMMDSVGHYIQYEKHRSHEDMEGEEDHFEIGHEEHDEEDDEGNEEEFEFDPSEEDDFEVDGEEYDEDEDVG